jgi:PKD repeat protein
MKISSQTIYSFFFAFFLVTITGTALASNSVLYAENYSCVAEWSLPGHGTGTWGYYDPANGPYNIPIGIALDPSGNFYVADKANNSILKLDSNGTLIKRWGSYGNATGQFENPRGVTVDSSGDVYIADSGNCRIQKFDSNGNFITTWGSVGIGDGQFNNILSIAVDSSDYIYVAGDSPDRIQKFDSDGKFVSRFGMGDIEYPIYDPYGIAVDASGNIYVVDGEGCIVTELNSTGGFVRDFGTNGGYSHGDGQLGTPSGVAVDSLGNVYVSENFYTDETGFAYGSQIQKFNNTGSFITRWGSYGNGLGQFNGTGGIAVDSSGNVYVTDYGGNRLGKFVSDNPIVTPLEPDANFTSNVTEGYAPLAVQFNDSSKNVDQWYWNFGDGTNSTEQNPEHIYYIPGTYILNLTVSNANGTDSKLATINVSSAPSIPVLPGCTNPPTDPDHDGHYEDVNGNGINDFNDVSAYYDNMEWIEENATPAFFDYNNNSLIDFNDVVKLYDML